MFTRVISRNFYSALQCIKLAPYSNGSLYKISINMEPRTLNIITHKNLEVRRYTQEANQGNDITVGYDYIKKAVKNENVMIIDVREPEELKEHGFIPSSINIPLGSVTTTLSTMSEEQFEKTYNKKKPTEDTEIIFYCMIGKRSGMAQQNAFNLGYKKAKNYLGSWTEWASKN